MRVHVTYPPKTARSFWLRNRRELWRSLFLLVGYTCLLINLLGGGSLWSLIAIGGLVVGWIILLYRPQVENTVIKKLCDSLIAVCLYLFLLDSLLGSGWGAIVVPIVYFGDLIIIGAYFGVFFKKQKRNFLPLFELMLAGVIASVLALAGLGRLDWPMLVAGSVSLGLLIVLLALFWKPLSREFQKKFHL
ncbi:MAG: DUF6320 domain-containing protein [Clostridia bacterium]